MHVVLWVFCLVVGGELLAVCGYVGVLGVRKTCHVGHVEPAGTDRNDVYDYFWYCLLNCPPNDYNLEKEAIAYAKFMADFFCVRCIC